MKRVSSTTLISIGLASLTMTVLLTAHSLGLIPDHTQNVLRARAQIVELLAAQCSVAAQTQDDTMMDAVITQVMANNPDILSAAVRRADGELMHVAGDHGAHWTNAPPDGRSTPTHVQVPIFEHETRWGTVEIAFIPLGAHGLSILNNPVLRLTLFVAAAGFFCFTFYLRRVLRHLDPSAVIPPRVRAILDSLAEGVVVLDREERIVLANESFSESLGQNPEQLNGRKASHLNWTDEQSQEADRLPWLEAIKDSQTHKGIPLRLRDKTGTTRIFMVNAAPILGFDGKARGAMATFDDVTGVEDMNAKLRQTLAELEASRDEVARQNHELQILASRDSLTGCWNRRSLMEKFDKHWRQAKDTGGRLGCIMVDIDRFKSINDQHGHAAGDQILKEFAGILNANVRERDIVCRFGGEEFCILLPETDAEETFQVAEWLRQKIEARPWTITQVTASLGAAGIEFGAVQPSEMIDQADAALYVAKRTGRNKVVRWDEVPPEAQAGDVEKLLDRTNLPQSISPSVVVSLVSALRYRDRSTAEHSRRVAEWCLKMGLDLMAPHDCVVLGFAALLHDIGKLGVPDAVLLKPGALTAEEWTVMRSHEKRGTEIIAAIFDNQLMTEIVGQHHAQFGGDPQNPRAPRGNEIPLGARILTICDAYDAMVSDRVYRKGRPRAEAVAELRKCAGSQFDPELVERFIELIEGAELPPAAEADPAFIAEAARLSEEIDQLAARAQEAEVRALETITQQVRALADQPVQPVQPQNPTEKPAA